MSSGSNHNFKEFNLLFNKISGKIMEKDKTYNMLGYVKEKMHFNQILELRRRYMLENNMQAVG